MRQDYTTGALDTRRETLVAAAWRHLGPPTAAPTGALFTSDHIRDMCEDRRFYALADETAEGGPDRARQFLENTIKPRRWVQATKDCENRASDACTDLSDAATEAGWGANAAVGAIAYVSRSLRKTDEPWSGYHKALLVFKWRKAVGDFGLWIVEPKWLDEAGNEHSERWQLPENEVIRWVRFELK